MAGDRPKLEADASASAPGELTPILVDLAALARAVAPLVGMLASRPEYVTQRTVLAVLGMPPADYLYHCRAAHWPSRKDRRVVYAKTADVAAYLDRLPARVIGRPSVPTVAGDDAEARALARVGARRVSR